MKAYFGRLKNKGWTRYTILIPVELKDEVKAFKDRRIAELEATKKEEV